jgi:hypothetical protein
MCLFMRLAILISLCVIIVAFSIGSFLTYENWRTHRYDGLIMEKAVKYKLPPALLKAIVDARGHFDYYTMGEKGEVGLLQVPQEGVLQYKEANRPAKYEFGYVCINKAHKPHTGITYPVRGVCNICRSRLIPELWYPEQNIEIGAWYLAKLKSDIEGTGGGKQVNPNDVIPLVVAAYCLTENSVRSATNNYRNATLPARLRGSVTDILDEYEKYRGRL